MSGTSEEKELPASEKKLRKAREKGEIAHSQEMVTAAVVVTSFGYLILRAPSFAAYLQDGLLMLPDQYGAPFMPAVQAVAGRLGRDALAAVAPLAAVIAVTAILTNLVVNGGLVVSFDPVVPKVEKLDPIAGLKRMFGAKSWVELAKSLLKLGVAIYLVFALIRSALPALVEIPACALSCGSAVLGVLLKSLFLPMAGLFLALGALDIGLQRWLFLRDQRMTKSEQKREMKDSDGDPLIKQEHRKEFHADGPRIGRRNATFAIHSATTVLAMRYTESDTLVPTLVARAVGDAAVLLLADLRAQGVPLVYDEATAMALVQRLKLGMPIGEDMYAPVIACMHEAGLLRPA